MTHLDLIAESAVESRTVAVYPDSEKETQELLAALAPYADDDCASEHVSGEGYSGSESVGYYDVWGTDDDGDEWRIHIVASEVQR